MLKDVSKSQRQPEDVMTYNTLTLWICRHRRLYWTCWGQFNKINYLEMSST